MSQKKDNRKPKKNKVLSIIEWVFTGIFGTLFLVILIGQINGLINKKNNYGQLLTFGWGNFVVQTDSMKPDYEVGTAIVTHKDSPESLYQRFLEYEEYNAPIRKSYQEQFNIATVDARRFQIQQEMEKETKNIDITFYDGYNPDVQTRRDVQELLAKEHPYLTEETDNLVDLVTVGEGEVYPPLTHRLRDILYRPSIELGKGRYVFITSGTNLSEHFSQAHQYQIFTEKELIGVVKVNSPGLGGFFRFVNSIWGMLVLLLVPALFLIFSSVYDLMKKVDENEKLQEEKQKAQSGQALEGLSEEDRERLKSEMLQEMIAEQQKKKGGKK